MNQNEGYGDYLDKLSQMAIQFDKLYNRKEYARAHWIELQTEIIADFLELPRHVKSELFGWPDDGGDEKIPPPGLFNVNKVRYAGWQCCVYQHKSYQDVAARRKGIPLIPEYYSDEEYCIFKCPQASFGHREQIEKMRD